MNTAQLTSLHDRVRQSDRGAFEELFNHLWEEMERYSTSILDDPDMAKDLLQDLWLDYWKRSSSIEVENIKAYLFTALRFNCYKYLRDHKLTPLQEEVIESIEFELNVPDTDSQYGERLRQLQKSLDRLPERCRDIFVLSRINGLSNTEIAENFGITKKTVENQISSATRRLRKDISNLSSLLFSIF